MKTYEGKLAKDKATVTVTEGSTTYLLDPCFDIVRHSPTGFNWGYGGSGPAQLALAILADFFGDKGKAQGLYQNFKAKAIMKLENGKSWTLTSEDIEKALADIEK